MNKLIILSLFILFSCGTRKVSKSKIEEHQEVKTEITSDIKLNKIDTTTINTECLEDEFEITPIDSTKEIIYNNNGKIIKIKNGVLKTKNKKTISVYQNKKTIDSTALFKATKDDKKDISIEQKDIDRKGSIIEWYISLVIIILLIIFLVYNKFKN